MPDPNDDLFDYPIEPEVPFLQKLTEELRDTFRVIAYAQKGEDKSYIKNNQEYFREKYGKLLTEEVTSDIGILRVIPAYDVLQNLLKYDPTSDEIVQECTNCLEGYLTPGERPEHYENAFQEFYRRHPEG